MRRAQNMNMVSVAPYPLKLNVVALLNPSRRLNYDPNHIIIQQRFPILHRKHDVVMYLPGAMTPFLNYTFAHPTILGGSVSPRQDRAE